MRKMSEVHLYAQQEKKVTMLSVFSLQENDTSWRRGAYKIEETLAENLLIWSGSQSAAGLTSTWHGSTTSFF